MSKIFSDGTVYKTKEQEREELKRLTKEWLAAGNRITVLKSQTERTLDYRAKASSK